MNLLRFVSAAALAALPLGALAGCGAKVATVLSTEDSGTLPPEAGPDSATANTCVPRGGVCLPSGESAPPNRRVASAAEGRCGGSDVCWVVIPAVPEVVCTTDVECNEDSEGTQALRGMCFHGICVCHEGYHVQPSGRCAAAAPPACAAQGGTCVMDRLACGAGKLSSEPEVAATCGSLIEQACCFDEAACRGPMKPGTGGVSSPVEFQCCAPNDAVHPPICVHGHQTCIPGDLPVDKALGGCG